MTDQITEFISRERISTRVVELAKQISDDYRDKDFVIIGILKGAFIFLADLVREMDVSPTIDFLRIASYGQATEASGVVEIRKDLEISVTDRDLLVVEDIIDTGLTADYIARHLQAGKPHSVRFAALLDKPSQRRVDFKVDYVGFHIDKEFVVGYGLDYAEKYRDLSSIHILHTDQQ